MLQVYELQQSFLLIVLHAFFRNGVLIRDQGFYLGDIARIGRSAMSTFQFITVIGRRVMRCGDHNTLVCFLGQYTIGNHRGTDKSFGSIYFDTIIAEHAGNSLYKQ
ncbi:hypothetical protein D3C86_1402780 [compost metagenome]